MKIEVLSPKKGMKSIKRTQTLDASMLQDQSFAFGGITPINPSPVDQFPKPKKMGSIDWTDDQNLMAPSKPIASDRSRVDDISHVNINVD